MSAMDDQKVEPTRFLNQFNVKIHPTNDFQWPKHIHNETEFKELERVGDHNKRIRSAAYQVRWSKTSWLLQEKDLYQEIVFAPPEREYGIAELYKDIINDLKSPINYMRQQIADCFKSVPPEHILSARELRTARRELKNNYEVERHHNKQIVLFRKAFKLLKKPKLPSHHQPCNTLSDVSPDEETQRLEELRLYSLQQMPPPHPHMVAIPVFEKLRHDHEVFEEENQRQTEVYVCGRYHNYCGRDKIFALKDHGGAGVLRALFHSKNAVVSYPEDRLLPSEQEKLKIKQQLEQEEKKQHFTLRKLQKAIFNMSRSPIKAATLYQQPHISQELLRKELKLSAGVFDADKPIVKPNNTSQQFIEEPLKLQQRKQQSRLHNNNDKDDDNSDSNPCEEDDDDEMNDLLHTAYYNKTHNSPEQRHARRRHKKRQQAIRQTKNHQTQMELRAADKDRDLTPVERAARALDIEVKTLQRMWGNHVQNLNHVSSAPPPITQAQHDTTNTGGDSKVITGDKKIEDGRGEDGNEDEDDDDNDDLSTAAIRSDAYSFQSVQSHVPEHMNIQFQRQRTIKKLDRYRLKTKFHLVSLKRANKKINN